MLMKMDMSTNIDKWSYFTARVQEGLGNYEPNPLIAELIKVLLKNRYEGIILIGNEGRIAFMDKSTEKSFGLSPGGAKDRPFSDFFPELGILEVLKTGVPQIGQIQEIGGQKKVVTRFPIIKDGQIIGAAGRVVFHELEVVKNLSAKIQKLEEKISRFKEDFMAQHRTRYTFDNILGISSSIKETKKIAKRIALTDSTVLLIGESGTGKELFAHSIHQASKRSGHPFVRVNCASIPFELAESELFGYKKGAFTGAERHGLKGKFELASKGTIFLDEIGSMPLTIQAKLLRVLQDKEIQPLGSTEIQKVDFRLIAATNMDLSKLVKKGVFRADLYYRLSSVPIYLPPLRERPEDITFLINLLLPSINQKLNGIITSIDSGSLDMLCSYNWPGNIRELINVLEQAVLNAYSKTQIQINDLPKFLHHISQNNSKLENGIKGVTADAERKAIMKALELCNGNKRKASKLLGISRACLYKKLTSHNLS
jgi:transcriptional regulator with PAS, ATPase and Fis domain